MGQYDLSFSKLFNDFQSNDFMKKFDSFMSSDFTFLTDDDLIKINAIAISLVNDPDEYIKRLGYHLIIKYSLVTSNFEPLYEISKHFFNTPILHLLQNNNYKRSLLLDEIDRIVIDSTKEKRNGENVYYTYEQKIMRSKFINSDNDMAIIAPTSFGKTDLMMDYVVENYHTKIICIIVPTKALINQTRVELIKALSKETNTPKIITHHDIKPSLSKRNVFVMTQERLHRFLFDKKTEIIIDVLLVDEAHNMFDNHERAKLLSKLIVFLKNSNVNFQVKYFSPIIKEGQNLNQKYVKQGNIIENKVKPFIKTEDFYYVHCTSDEKFIKLYNPYFNSWIDIDSEFKGKYDFIIKNAGKKNIIYVNSPRRLKESAKYLSNELLTLDSVQLMKMIRNISSYVNEHYDMLDLLRRGVVYHCGIIPDNIRFYIEKCVKEIPELKYVFCTSTLLEGVNMPFNKMFIIDIWKGKSHLNYHELQNLVGRVNRYSLIFKNQEFNIDSLISKIYFIKDDSSNRNDNYQSFIEDNLKCLSNSSKRNDPVENPYLEKSKKELSDYELSLLNNLLIEPIADVGLQIVKTNVGRLMIEQDMIDCNIFKFEEIIQARIDNWQCDNNYSVIDKIYNIFIKDITYEDESHILELENDSARKYYDHLIDWKKRNLSFAQMISNVIYYWRNVSPTNHIYVGKKWGDTLIHDDKDTHCFIDRNNKSDKELANYAIVKVKEDLDFFDFYIVRYIEILHKIHLLDNDLYKLIRYGTTDDMQIFFINEGLSSELAKLLASKKYEMYIFRNTENEYILNPKIFEYFSSENEIITLELKYYLKKT